jgi:hypothetical protein
MAHAVQVGDGRAFVIEHQPVGGTQRLLHVARVICSENPLTLMFQPLLSALRNATGETAGLATLASNHVQVLRFP